MRTMMWGLATMAAAAGLRGVPAHTVSSVEYLGTYFGASRVSVWRGQSADLVVVGSLVDLNTGVEVKTSSGQAASGLSASVTSVVHGAGSRITIHLASGSATATGNYDILIHYLVETNGPDKVSVRLYEKGTVTAIHLVEPPEDGSRYAIGKIYTLSASGSGLANAALKAKTGMQVVSTLSRSNTQAQFQVRFTTASSVSIGAWDFFDDAILPNAPTDAQRLVAGFGPSSGGSDLLGVVAAIRPTVTSVSPTNPSRGATTTLSGTDLAPRGYNAEVHFAARYRPDAGSTEVRVPASIGGTSVQFSAPAATRGDGGRLTYSAIASAPQIDSIVHVSVSLPAMSIDQPPVVTQVGTSLVTSPSPVELFQGNGVLLGNFLVSDGGPTCLSKSCGVGSGTAPTVKLGTATLAVTSAVYSSTAAAVGPGNHNQVGIDSVRITVPAIAGPGGVVDTLTTTLTVTTSDGSITVPRVFYAPKPQISAVQTVAAPHTAATSTLVRGVTYELVGRAMRLVPAGIVRSTGQVQLNGASIPTFDSPTAGNRTFTVPAAATSGALTVSTLAGTTTVGTFTVTDGNAGVSIAGMQLSPATLIGGGTITATIAVNAVIPPGGSAGNLVLSTTAPDTTLLLPTALIPVTSNPVVVQIPTRAVAASHSNALIARNEATSAVQTSASGAFTLQAAALTSIAFTSPSVSGGRNAVLNLNFNTPIALGLTLPVTLTSSDPAAAAVPASVNAAGSSIGVAVSTKVVGSNRPVTITATMNGQTQTAALTVNAPQPFTLAFDRATSVAETADSATLTLTAAPIGPITATIECSDSALVCPASVTVNSLTTKFPVSSTAIPAPRTATVSITANGATTSGSVNLVPLAIQSVTISPGSVTAGTSASMTIQLNGAVPANTSFAVQIGSSNTAVVATPQTQTFSTGAVTKLVVLPTHTPVTASTGVTLTASFTRSTSFGPGTSSASSTLTVTP